MQCIEYKIQQISSKLWHFLDHLIVTLDQNHYFKGGIQTVYVFKTIYFLRYVNFMLHNSSSNISNSPHSKSVKFVF